MPEARLARQEHLALLLQRHPGASAAQLQALGELVAVEGADLANAALSLMQLGAQVTRLGLRPQAMERRVRWCSARATAHRTHRLRHWFEHEMSSSVATSGSLSLCGCCTRAGFVEQL